MTVDDSHVTGDWRLHPHKLYSLFIITQQTQTIHNHKGKICVKYFQYTRNQQGDDWEATWRDIERNLLKFAIVALQSVALEAVIATLHILRTTCMWACNMCTYFHLSW